MPLHQQTVRIDAIRRAGDERTHTVVGDRNNNGLFSCDTPLLFSPTAEENVSLILLLKDSFWG